MESLLVRCRRFGSKLTTRSLPVAAVIVLMLATVVGRAEAKTSSRRAPTTASHRTSKPSREPSAKHPWASKAKAAPAAAATTKRAEEPASFGGGFTRRNANAKATKPSPSAKKIRARSAKPSTRTHADANAKNTNNAKANAKPR